MLKRETRVLGLSGAVLRRRIIIAGVVFRGSLWLDGVFTLSLGLNERNFLSKLAGAIRKTKQFSQLHVIVVSRRFVFSGRTSIVDLSRRLRLPVIAVSDARSRMRRVAPRARKMRFPVGGGRVFVWVAGTELDEAERLYSIGCSKGSIIPEAVRVAELLTQQLT